MTETIAEAGPVVEPRLRTKFPEMWIKFDMGRDGQVHIDLQSQISAEVLERDCGVPYRIVRIPAEGEPSAVEALQACVLVMQRTEDMRASDMEWIREDKENHANALQAAFLVPGVKT